jgi:hypothetical protein
VQQPTATTAKPIDPDHIRTEVGEECRAERDRTNACELKNPEAGKWSVTCGGFVRDFRSPTIFEFFNTIGP